MSETTSINPNGHNQPPAPSPQSQRAAINRANAQHSTGPRTEAGKRRSSLNALRHGLTSHVIVMPGEDLAAFKRYSQEAFDEFQPKTWNEKDLLHRLVAVSWKLHRVDALDNNALSLGVTKHVPGLDAKDPEIYGALAMAATLRDQSQFFANLAMQAHRLSRERERILKQLLELQAARREREGKDMEKAGELLQMHAEQGLPYQPAEDGFVFSNPEIETYVRRKERLDDASGAALSRFYAKYAAK